MKSKKFKLQISIGQVVVFLLFYTVLFCSWYGYIKVPFLVYNKTPSVPMGWYIMLPASDISDGDIVGFTLPKKYEDMVRDREWTTASDNEDLILLKIVGCTEGESFEIKNDNSFWIKGKYIGQVIERDGQGRELPKLNSGTYYIPAGCFLPYTENPMSFDGRYYGPIELEKIRFKAFPFLIDFFSY